MTGGQLADLKSASEYPTRSVKAWFSSRKWPSSSIVAMGSLTSSKPGRRSRAGPVSRLRPKRGRRGSAASAAAPTVGAPFAAAPVAPFAGAPAPARTPPAAAPGRAASPPMGATGGWPAPAEPGRARPAAPPPAPPTARAPLPASPAGSRSALLGGAGGVARAFGVAFGDARRGLRARRIVAASGGRLRGAGCVLLRGGRGDVGALRLLAGDRGGLGRAGSMIARGGGRLGRARCVPLGRGCCTFRAARDLRDLGPVGTGHRVPALDGGKPLVHLRRLSFDGAEPLVGSSSLSFDGAEPLVGSSGLSFDGAEPFVYAPGLRLDGPQPVVHPRRPAVDVRQLRLDQTGLRLHPRRRILRPLGLLARPPRRLLGRPGVRAALPRPPRPFLDGRQDLPCLAHFGVELRDGLACLAGPRVDLLQRLACHPLDGRPILLRRGRRLTYLLGQVAELRGVDGAFDRAGPEAGELLAQVAEEDSRLLVAHRRDLNLLDARPHGLDEPPQVLQLASQSPVVLGALALERALKRLEPLALRTALTRKLLEPPAGGGQLGLDVLPLLGMDAFDLLDAGARVGELGVKSGALLAAGLLDRLQSRALLAPSPLQPLQPLRGARQRLLQALALRCPLRFDRFDPLAGRGQLLSQRSGGLLGRLAGPRVRQPRLQRCHPGVRRLDPSRQPLPIRHRSLERGNLFACLLQLPPQAFLLRGRARQVAPQLLDRPLQLVQPPPQPLALRLPVLRVTSQPLALLAGLLLARRPRPPKLAAHPLDLRGHLLEHPARVGQLGAELRAGLLELLQPGARPRGLAAQRIGLRARRRQLRVGCVLQQALDDVGLTQWRDDRLIAGIRCRL